VVQGKTASGEFWAVPKGTSTSIGTIRFDAALLKTKITSILGVFRKV
jgi:hypothetical protein